MKILLINPPHTAIGSRIPREHLPPLSLLSIGGSLLDAGHAVELLDADIDDMPLHDIVLEVAACAPDAVFVGHSGSNSAHPTVADLTRAIRCVTPSIKIVYGGIFPTYAWKSTLERIRKGGAVATDREAIRLLRKHGILSMATYVVGFEEEKDIDYLRSLRHLLSYDPDQIQLLYATPHHWTPYADEEAERRVIQPDLRKWDYKHQVLATRHVPSWRVMLWVKLIEAVMQGRPRALRRYLHHRDESILDAIRWYYRIGRKVWPYEIWQYLFHDRRIAHGPTLAEFQASPATPYKPDSAVQHPHPIPAQSSGAVCAWALPG